MASYTINASIKHGKYTEKVDSSHLNQVYLETGDSQVLLETALIIGGSTYSVGTPLSTVLSALNSGGALYSIAQGTTSSAVKLVKSTDGGTTWTDVASVTINNVLEAEYASKIGTYSSHPSIGGTTTPVYVNASGIITACTPYASASVLQASQDGSGNDIVSTYATKQELEDYAAGITTAYVTNATNAPAALVVSKDASQHTATLSGTKTSTITLADGTTTVTYDDIKVGDNVYLTDADKCDWFVGGKTVSGSNVTLTFYSIEADSPSLSGYVTASGTLTANKIILGNGSTSIYASNVAISNTAVAAGSAGVSTNILTEAATVSTIDNRINALDVSTITGFGPGKTLSTLTETDGKISATFQDISIGKSQITDFPSIPTLLSGSAGKVWGWDASGNPEAESISSGKQHDGTTEIVSTRNSSTGNLELGDSGVTAGVYSALEVNSKGIATAGGQILVFASSTSDAKIDSLVNGGCAVIYE